MPEPFKNVFNVPLVEAMGRHFHRHWRGFDRNGFTAAASAGLDGLELKARSDQITQAMAAFLPGDFEAAGGILLNSLSPDDDTDISGTETGEDGVAGWAILPMSHYVGLHGLDHFDLSMELLKEMTKRFSSEFGIRFFLLHDPDATLAVMKAWTRDPNRHVRRLVSEGTRPRLPWAMQLPRFVEDPSPILPLLESLKDDGEEYVRRSVANNLNDISKDHPEVVADVARSWMKAATPARAKLVRHGLRTLIKSGHRGALDVLGYGSPKLTLDRFDVVSETVSLGGALEFEVEIASTDNADQPLIIDYVVHHKRANGDSTPKVFKWKTATLKAGATLSGRRKHAIRPVTTRRYYAGRHRVELLVNGECLGGADFFLLTE